MARVNLRCTSCGYHFSVNDTETTKPGGAKCPSCLAPVGLDGPLDGGPARKPVRVLEAAPDKGSLKMKIAIGAGAGVLVLAAVVVVLLMKGSPPPDEKETAATPKRPAPAATKKEPRPAEKSPAAPKAGATAKAEEAPTPAPGTPVAPPGETVAQPAPAAPSQAAVPPLPEDLLKAAREDLLALKEWHFNLVVSAPEKTRLDALLAAGKGTPEDVEFLRGIVSGPRFRAVKEEMAMLREARARLEAEALEGLPVDKVVMNDARVLHGRILEKTDAGVKLERKITGSLIKMDLKSADIKDVQPGKGIGGEFKTRWEASKKAGSSALLGVLAWCKENTLSLQASLTAYAILVDDPGRSEARQEAGLATDPVARMQEAEKQGGFITYEGRRWVPRELKDKLLRDGYALVDGKWMKGTQRIVSVPSLFRYENQAVKPVQISGNVANDDVIKYTVVNGTAKADTQTMRRFYVAAPMTVSSTTRKSDPINDAEQYVVEDKGTPSQGSLMKGEVFITVPLNAPILEASVMTLAEVKSGTITVNLIVDGQRTKLYRCESKEDNSHKLPESIRGKREVQLVAEISGTASYTRKDRTDRVKRAKKDTNRVIEMGLDFVFKQLVPDYPAMLFPSNANTVEVFRLTVTTGEEAPPLDSLFQNAAEVLKK
jgi:hypothetical protein